MNGNVIWKIENTNPLLFENVQVWASSGRHGFPPADATIKDLEYENSGCVFCTVLSLK